MALLAAGCFAAIVTVVASLAGPTLGWDFQAYRDAALRVLSGQPLYDPSIVMAGPTGQYLYPPPFLLLVLPFALLPSVIATFGWTLLLVASVIAAIAVMPVSGRIRSLVLLLAAFHWPTMFAIKMGQVGPLLLLISALAWRSYASPTSFGVAATSGLFIKVQPGVLFVWAALARRWRSLGIGMAAAALGVLATVVIFGPSAWTSYLSLLLRISDPIHTPRSLTVGAILSRAGADDTTAAAAQWFVNAVVFGLVAFASLRRSPEAGIVAAITASQLLSPVIWGHYAIILLAPIAFLFERRAWWAGVIALSMSIPLLGITPDAAYPLAFLLAVAGVVALDHRPVVTEGSRGPVLSSPA